MRDDRDYKVELSSAAATRPSAAPAPSTPIPAGKASQASAARPFLNVHFACCNLYLRVYRATDGSAYRGRCPKCGRPVNFSVGEGGTDCRFFRVS